MLLQYFVNCFHSLEHNLFQTKPNFRRQNNLHPTPPTWPSTFIVVRKRFDVQDTSLMSQQTLIREKGGDGGNKIQCPKQFTREKLFIYRKSYLIGVFLFFLSIYSETPQRIVVWIERSQRLRQKILRYSYRSSGQGKPTSIIKNPMSFFTCLLLFQCRILMLLSQEEILILSTSEHSQ